MVNDFWAKVPRFGVRPKTWTEPYHEIDRLDAERGPLDKKDRPDALNKHTAAMKQRLVARNKARAKKP